VVIVEVAASGGTLKKNHEKALRRILGEKNGARPVNIQEQKDNPLERGVDGKG